MDGIRMNQCFLANFIIQVRQRMECLDNLTNVLYPISQGILGSPIESTIELLDFILLTF